MLAQHNGGMSTTPNERRARSRSRSLKQVKILTFDNNSVFDATLKNVTAYGAALSLSAPERVPDSFKLNFVFDEITVPCKVKWRRPGSLGVTF